MDKLYIIIPAYNESENIENLINDWYPIIEKHNGNGNLNLNILVQLCRTRIFIVLKKQKSQIQEYPLLMIR